MKNIICYLFFFLAITHISIAQKDTIPADKLQDKKEIFSHQYGTIYINQNYNDVANQLGDYLQMVLQMNASEPSIGKNGEVITKYTTKMGELRTLKTSFFLKKNNTISKITVVGDWLPVVDLFVGYWPTRIKFNDQTIGATASCMAGNDKIEITSNYPKATIIIK